jgi:hypothetical protein
MGDKVLFLKSALEDLRLQSNKLSMVSHSLSHLPRIRIVYPCEFIIIKLEVEFFSLEKRAKDAIQWQKPTKLNFEYISQIIHPDKEIRFFWAASLKLLPQPTSKTRFLCQYIRKGFAKECSGVCRICHTRHTFSPHFL